MLCPPHSQKKITPFVAVIMLRCIFPCIDKYFIERILFIDKIDKIIYGVCDSKKILLSKGYSRVSNNSLYHIIVQLGKILEKNKRP